MTIEFTEFERPTRLASWTGLSTMDIRGTLTFQPIDGSTRMKWSWLFEPHGLMRFVPPAVIAGIGPPPRESHLVESQASVGTDI
jgi:hypothetical protein